MYNFISTKNFLKVPICKPEFDEEAVQDVANAVKSGWVSAGEQVIQFEEKLAEYFGVKHAITINSGTAAIDVALRALGLRNKEILTTATSCSPTAEGIVGSSNTPVMVDISKEDYNIDTGKIEESITKNTGAILPVHLYGRPAEMDKILEIGKKHNIPVVEDCAQATGAKYKAKKVGSFADIGCFSLNISKIITTGEGGFITTDNDEIEKTAKIVRNYGRDPKNTDFLYEYYGYNFKYTNLHAALGLSQVKKIDSYIRSRRENAAYLKKQLEGLPNLQLPTERPHEFSVYFCFPMLLKKTGVRDNLKRFLEERGIESRTLFRPMFKQPYYVEIFGENNIPCPNAEYVGNNGFYAGCCPGLTKEQLDYIADSIKEGLKLYASG